MKIFSRILPSDNSEISGSKLHINSHRARRSRSTKVGAVALVDRALRCTMATPCGAAASKTGFTILELLVSVTVLLIVMGFLLQLTGGIGEIWKSSSGKISGFQNARSAFASITRTLSLATLNTYNDYVNTAGEPRTEVNRNTFVPANFARASELHFLSGPATSIIPGATVSLNPGQAIVFQAPLGVTDNTNLSSLNRTVNSVGFFIQYATTDETLLPAWLRDIFRTEHRFRLVQVVEPTEKLKVYDSTKNANYTNTWLGAFTTPPAANNPRARVLAEDVCLLVFRPRLSPKDEESAATQLSEVYTDDKIGSILTPNYHYDSRAWQTGYPAGRVSPAKRAEIMRNQIPPIVDVAMVSVDRRSLARFDVKSATPPSEFAVPAGLFTDASQFEQDLTTYSSQLTNASIRHRIFRTSVELQGAKWSNTAN